MPYSFTQIQKDKSRVIIAAFVFLVVLYFLAIVTISVLFKNFGYFYNLWNNQRAVFDQSRFENFDVMTLIMILGLAALLAGIHWMSTVWGLVPRINRVLQARPPDVNRLEEKMFQNIVEEVVVATGGKPIQPMIIPTMMLNACAYADGQSVPVIAVTSGLLHKLNRSQIEAVVGHEAGHVVSGDGQETTIISSMFEVFGAALLTFRTTLSAFDDGNDLSPASDRWRYGGRWSKDNSSSSNVLFVIIFIAAIMTIIWLVDRLATLMRMFISRQREYRADAVAVQLTRNPLALAEALYIISNRRHAIYPGIDSLQTLFFVNTVDNPLDEGLGVVNDLFSTHPPVEERIKILLTMAYVEHDQVERALKDVNQKEELELQERQKIIGKAQGGLWFVMTPANVWSGPHNMDALLSFPWLTPQTLVKKMGENTSIPLAAMQNYMQNYHELLRQQPKFVCPACTGKLSPVVYEHNDIFECQQCHGFLVPEDSVSVILARKEKIFDQRIQNAAAILLKEAPLNKLDWGQSIESDRIYRCERCAHDPHKLRRRLFNNYYPIEIDKCSACGLIWFDKDELEIMQCIYEQRERQNQSPLTS